MIKCPYCGYDKNDTFDTRDSTKGRVRRRRRCRNCKQAFTTYEVVMTDEEWYDPNFVKFNLFRRGKKGER